MSTHNSNSSEDNHENDRFQHILHETVADIDEMQAAKDPNYNSTYAWSIARMKQDEEVCCCVMFGSFYFDAVYALFYSILDDDS